MNTWKNKTSLTLIFSLTLLASFAKAASLDRGNDNFLAPPQVANGVIIKYKDAGSSYRRDRAGFAAAVDGRMKALSNKLRISAKHKRFLGDGSLLADIGGVTTMEAARDVAARIIAADPDIEFVEPNVRMYPAMVPNDTRYADQWHYFEADGGINVERAWDIVRGSGVVVAVLDTGSLNHVDMAGQFLPGYDFIADLNTAVDGDGRDDDPTDPGDWVNANVCWLGAPARDSSWHGTHVSGTIAALTHNNQGVAGVAHEARIVPVRVLGRCGGWLADIADGIRWAAGLAVNGVPANNNPAQVINMSLGGGGACGNVYQNAIDAARAEGATIVVAAGNNNVDAVNFRPANCNNVITVAANDRDGARAFYSNFGNVIEITAPGGETLVATDGVLSTLNAGARDAGVDNYEFYQGTSMATPHVAGVAALLYSAYPGITVDKVEGFIAGTARDFPAVLTNQCTTNNCGAGIVDAAEAVEAARGEFVAAVIVPMLNLMF